MNIKTYKYLTYNVVLKVFITLLIIFSIVGCTVNWTKAIQYGSIIPDEIDESVEVEIKRDLIIIPVTIEGKKYRFLLDTGAPFSISEEVQKRNNFRIISKGNLIDSDKNRKRIVWAQVDSISIGNVKFINQSAFIGDFSANPMLKCLEIDGIVGSNLIRQANWTIDHENNKISIYDKVPSDLYDEAIIIPFEFDHQYDIFIDIDFGRATVNHILLDYGSNGSMSLGKDVFNVLKQKDIIDTTLTVTGFRQSGIVGRPVKLDSEITISDSIKIDTLHLNDILVRSGKNTSIGNAFLSRFLVTIDWNRKNLLFTNYHKEPEKKGITGFTLGYSDEKGIFIQSVVHRSNAYNEGVRTGMKVIRIDSLNFENGNEFCDIVNHKFPDNIYLQLQNSEGQPLDFHLVKTKF